FTQICHRGVDTVHLCVDTSSLSQKPFACGVDTSSLSQKLSLKTMPVVSTQCPVVSTHFD
ncbi:hypothetical protein Taro_002643, partial [Colocasia esculenta]|nr:hypothetical protein [Colocasia esculenta]